MVFFLLFAFYGFSSPFLITIEGNFPGADGQEVRLMEYADLISYREVEITSAVVDDQGIFSLQLSRFEPQFVFFRVDHARMGFFIEPGKDYFFEFEYIDFDQLDDRINPYLEPWIFNYQLKEEGTSLNQDINNFEEVLYEGLTEHFAMIRLTRNANLFESIIQETDSLFGDIQNPWFVDYYRYKIAYYRHVANISRFENLVRDYILNQPVQYTNTQYMNLFNVLFDKYIFAGSRRIAASDLRFTVNELASYHALMDSLGKDTILRNEVVRELVMIKGLQDMYDDPDYRQNNVASILDWVATESKFPQHRIIAQNILHSKSYLRQGNPAPLISLQTSQGDLKEIPRDYAGKYVYLAFWASWCESCQLDFLALREMVSRFDDLEVLAISFDRHLTDYEDFLRNNDLPWGNKHFRGDFRLLDSYQIRSMPTYVLIDRQGNILSYPAHRPSDALFTHIEWLLHQERRERR